MPSLLERAQAVNPAIHSSLERAKAARARVSPAGARPDPMLMLGVINVPVRSLSFTQDDMTMKMVGIQQTLPYRGKLGLRQRVAEHEAAAVEARADSVRLAVMRDVKSAYFELVYLDSALAVVRRSGAVLSDIATVANARYAVGKGTQPEVLRAGLDATRLNESANALLEQRRSTLARLNALLDRPSDIPLVGPTISPQLIRAAVSEPATSSFVSQTLGAAITGSLLPPLDELQLLALSSSPSIRAHREMTAAAGADVELSRKDYLPDVDVSLQYGQRSGYSATGHGALAARADMVSAVVTIPLPIQRGRKQNALVAASTADLAAVEAEQHDAENAVRADVARLYNDIEHSRTLLALYSRAIIPQGRATLASATAAYQSGTGDLVSALTAQMTVFELETSYYRALADFAQRIAELEAIVGTEIIR